MDDREALYAAICANPYEDTPRLMYADWLEEHDKAEVAARIRRAVEASRFPEGSVEGDFLKAWVQRELKQHFSCKYERLEKASGKELGSPAYISDDPHHYIQALHGLPQNYPLKGSVYEFQVPASFVLRDEFHVLCDCLYLRHLVVLDVTDENRQQVTDTLRRVSHEMHPEGRHQPPLSIADDAILLPPGASSPQARAGFIDEMTVTADFLLSNGFAELQKRYPLRKVLVQGLTELNAADVMRRLDECNIVRVAVQMDMNVMPPPDRYFPQRIMRNLLREHAQNLEELDLSRNWLNFAVGPEDYEFCSNAAALRGVGRLPKLKSLKLAGDDWQKDILYQFPALQDLANENTISGPNDPSTFERFVQDIGWDSLKTLQLSLLNPNESWDSGASRHLGALTRRLPSLEALKFRLRGEYNERAVKDLADATKHMCNLRDLTLDMQCEGDDLGMLLKAIDCSCNNLEALDIRQCRRTQGASTVPFSPLFSQLRLLVLETPGDLPRYAPKQIVSLLQAYPNLAAPGALVTAFSESEMEKILSEAQKPETQAAVDSAERTAGEKHERA